jgi:hypothetical protein
VRHSQMVHAACLILSWAQAAVAVAVMLRCHIVDKKRSLLCRLTAVLVLCLVRWLFEGVLEGCGSWLHSAERCTAWCCILHSIASNPITLQLLSIVGLMRAPQHLHSLFVDYSAHCTAGWFLLILVREALVCIWGTT